MEILKKCYLYFLPGIIPTLLLLIAHRVYGERWPSITILIILDLLITIPLMIYLISVESHKPFGFGAIKEIFDMQIRMDLWPTFGLIFLSLLWAICSFILLKPVNELLQHHLFQWIPDWFSPGLYPGKHDTSVMKLSWLLMIPFSVLMPLMEEIYFRGFLLPREHFDDWRAPLLNTILFCAYHLWSPQLFVTRVIAIFPMNYLVWRYKNIYLSIIPHVLLNVIGDVVLTYPLIFG
tara:strand:- start:1036 stop:1740 length:705 start_codon:yes stop_codon:yes gene_type:complete